MKYGHFRSTFALVLGMTVSACASASPEPTGADAEPVTIAPGDYTITWPALACRLTQVSALRFRASGAAAWRRLGVSAADVAEVERLYDGAAGHLVDGIEGICDTTRGFAAFDAPGAYAVDAQTNTWTRRLNAKLADIATRYRPILGAWSADDANTLLQVALLRAIDENPDGFPSLAFYAPRAQFDAALSALRLRTSAVRPQSRAVRSLSFGLGGAAGCVSKKQTKDEWVNGHHMVEWQTHYQDGSTVTQEERFDQEGRVYYVRTVRDPGNGAVKTSVTLDGTRDLDDRAAYFADKANNASLAATAMGLPAAYAGLVPEPVISKTVGACFAAVATGYLALAAYDRILAAYYGRKQYFPDTLDTTPCEHDDNAPDGGAPDASTSEGGEDGALAQNSDGTYGPLHLYPCPTMTGGNWSNADEKSHAGFYPPGSTQPNGQRCPDPGCCWTYR